MFFQNVKAKTIWIIVAVVLIITIGLVAAVAFVPEGWRRVIIVGMVVGFLSLTFLIQWACFKSFKVKIKVEHNPREFTSKENLDDILKADKFIEKERDYGKTYLKISKPNAYKVSFVTNSDVYFNPTDEPEGKPNPDLDACDRMICFEIFLNLKKEDIDRICEYSIQGKNVYYTSFYLTEKNTFICPNYMEPSENHKRNYEFLMNELGFVLKSEE